MARIYIRPWLQLIPMKTVSELSTEKEDGDENIQKMEEMMEVKEEMEKLLRYTPNKRSDEEERTVATTNTQ